MKFLPSLGEQEIEILRYVAICESPSVREVAEYFEKQKGLARTTILTVMERLRKKGYLKRAKVNGIFRYSEKIENETVMKGKVSEFIERTLGGSMAPLLNYFAGNKELTEEEVNKLRTIIADFDKKGGA